MSGLEIPGIFLDFSNKNFLIKRQQILKFTWEMDSGGFWILELDFRQHGVRGCPSNASIHLWNYWAKNKLCRPQERLRKASVGGLYKKELLRSPLFQQPGQKLYYFSTKFLKLYTRHPLFQTLLWTTHFFKIRLTSGFMTYFRFTLVQFLKNHGFDKYSFAIAQNDH